MKIISHRGNLTGSISDQENHPSYIQIAIDSGYEVEVDVWFVDEQFYLGHDKPQHFIDDSWLKDRSSLLWCHAKNQEALEQLWGMNLLLGTINYFWHENDRMTLTSHGIPWLFPGNYSELGVTVHLDKPDSFFHKMFGVCTDYPISWQSAVSTYKENI